MSCHVMLRHATPRHATHTTPHHTTPHHTIPYHTHTLCNNYTLCNDLFLLQRIFRPFAYTIIGSYIYIEASTPRVKGDKAAIEVGPFKANQNFCFTFYYHMFGMHIGALSVYRSWFNRTNVQRLWSRNTSSGIYWRESSLDVRSTKKFYVSTVDGFYTPLAGNKLCIKKLPLENWMFYLSQSTLFDANYVRIDFKLYQNYTSCFGP